ncbi:site-specific integrase [Telmatospirillum sp. J64-1]|uniref:tyrosine-type recombinase/integrase n=1 Tax=Telmatospirillum sp. J64-1 TaxID=2502183 RepID=UPI00115F0CDD|nr:site-specific integrase [Telmatospirillum sp. J64-1]
MNKSRPARTIGEKEVRQLLAQCADTRYPRRNRLIVLLTYDAGLKVGEISQARRSHMMRNGELVPELQVFRHRKARIVPMTDRLFAACLDMLRGLPGLPEMPLILSERSTDLLTPMRPDSIAYLLYRLFEKAGIEGASSHSGRRAFLQRAMIATKHVEGATLKDVQMIGGFSHLEALRPYEVSSGDPEAQRRLIQSLVKRPENGTA